MAEEGAPRRRTGGWGRLASATGLDNADNPPPATRSVSTPVNGAKPTATTPKHLEAEAHEEVVENKSGFVQKMDGFFEEGELSGIKFFHSSFPTWFRLMWIVCMFVFLGMMIYQLIDLILQFQENPLSIDIKYENPDVLKLPSILACPHNQMRLTKLAEAGAMDYVGLTRLAQAGQMTEEEFTERMNFVTESWPADKRKLTTLWQIVEQFAESPECSLAKFGEKLEAYRGEVERVRLLYAEPFPVYTVNYTLGALVAAADSFQTNLDLGMKAGENCTTLGDMAQLAGPVAAMAEAGKATSLNGSFDGLLNVSASRPDEFIVSCRYQDENPISCNRNWTVVETIFGRCFLLNLTQTNVTRAGIDFALNIQFDTAVSDAATNVDKGMTITLIPEGRPAIVMEPIEINPGYNLHLPLRFTKEEYYESECSEAELKILPEYSQSGCMLQNFLELSQSECGCTPHSDINLGPADCSIAQQLGCVARLRHNITNVWDSKACKVSCEERRYESSMSYSTNDAEKGSREVTSHDRKPWKDIGTEDPLGRTLYTHMAALKGEANASIHLDPKADLYGEEWKNRTMSIMTHQTRLESTAYIRQALQMAVKAKADDLKHKIYYKAFYPMFRFTMSKLMFGMFYHGSEYGAWPMQTKDIKDMETMANMSQCRIKDLLFPIPPTFQRNYTAYIVANSLTPFKTKVEGAKATGKAVLLGKADEWIDVLVGSLRTSVEEGQTSGQPDGIAEQLLPLALPYQSCVKDPTSNCSDLSTPDGEDVACKRSCQAELDPLAYALEFTIQVRDIAFLTRQYQTELNDLLRIMGTLMEGIVRSYMEAFLDAYGGWKGYTGRSVLEHAKYYLENFASWEGYYVSVRDKIKSIQAKLDFMTGVTEPTRVKLLFDISNLTLSSDYDRFFDTFDCLRHYQYIWEEVFADDFLSRPEYRQQMKQVKEEAELDAEVAEAGPTYFRKNVMSATIYLAEMKQKVQEQRLAYDFWSMLSDIGGTISFYIGGTIITFFEILFMCTNCHKKRKLKIRIRRKREQVMANMGAVTAFKMAGNKTLGGGSSDGAASRALGNIGGNLAKASVAGIQGPRGNGTTPSLAPHSEKPLLGQIYKPRQPNAAGAALIAKLREDPSIADEAKRVAGSATPPQKEPKAVYVPRTPNAVGAALIAKLREDPTIADEAPAREPVSGFQKEVVNGTEDHPYTPRSMVRPDTAVITVGSDEEPPRYTALM